MAKKKETKVISVEVEKPVEVKSGLARVTTKKGVREFSLAIHGADYEKLAYEFAEKHNGVVE